MALHAAPSVGEVTAFGARAAVRTFTWYAFLLIPLLWIAGVFLRRAGLGARILGLILVGTGAWLVASFRLPPDVLYTPGFESTRGIQANVGLGILALAAACLWMPRMRLPGLRAGAALSISGLVAALGWSTFAGPAPAAWPGRPNLVLISLDTTRADHLGCYGYDQQTTPFLDAFAEQALRFERAYTVDCWTLTAHMTMLTGLTPSVHGVDRETALSNLAPTLPELLSDAGYTTLGVVDDCTWLDPRFGFARGFDVYRRVDAPADEKVEQVLSLLDNTGDAPFFLFAHFFDAHSDWEGLPYEAEPEDAEALAGWYTGGWNGCDEAGNCGSQFMQALNQGKASLSEEEQRFVEAMYDAGLRSMDRSVARLFHELEQRGLLENTVVIITADHGEEFFEHGKVLHTQHHEECIRVPLIIRSPETRGGASEALVSLTDLLPTFLDYAGSDQGGGRGYSLRPLIEGEQSDLSRSYVTTDNRGSLCSVRSRSSTFVVLDDCWLVVDESGERPLNTDDPSPEERELIDWVAVERSAIQELRERYAQSQSRATISAAEQRALAGIGYGGDDEAEESPPPLDEPESLDD